MELTTPSCFRGLLLGGWLLLSIGIPATAQAPLPDTAIIERVVQTLEDGTALPTLPARYQQALATFLATYDATHRGRPGSEQALLTSLREFNAKELEWIKDQRR